MYSGSIIKETQIEVVQNVTSSVRTKLGDFLDRQEPTVLDKLLPPGTQIQTWSTLVRSNLLATFNRWKTGSQGLCVFLNDMKLRTYDKDMKQLEEIQCRAYYANFIVCWRDVFLIAQWRDPVMIVGKHLGRSLVTKNSILSEFAPKIVTTKKFAYFKNLDSKIVGLAVNLSEQIVHRGPVEDFEFDRYRRDYPDQKESSLPLIILTKNGRIENSNGAICELPKDNASKKFYAIKLLRKRFLVVVDRVARLDLPLAEQKIGLHLVHAHSLKHAHYLDLEQSADYNPMTFCNLAPRVDIQLLLMAVGKTVTLVAEHNQKLVKVHSVTLLNTGVHSISSLNDGTFFLSQTSSSFSILKVKHV